MEHKKEQRHKRSSKSQTTTLSEKIRKARNHVIHFKSDNVIYRILFSSIALALIALGLFVMTLLIPVSPNVNVLGIYLRNGLSAALFAFTGIYMLCWCRLFIGEIKTKWFLKSVALITFLIALARGMYSVYLVIFMVNTSLYSMIYYSIDAFASLTLALFVAHFSISVLFSKLRTHNIFKKMTLFIAAVCLANTIANAGYTYLNFSPAGFAWLYYLACSLAWLILCLCFFVLAYSRFVDRKTIEPPKYVM